MSRALQAGLFTLLLLSSLAGGHFSPRLVSEYLQPGETFTKQNIDDERWLISISGRPALLFEHDRPVTDRNVIRPAYLAYLNKAGKGSANLPSPQERSAVSGLLSRFQRSRGGETGCLLKVGMSGCIDKASCLEQAARLGLPSQIANASVDLALAAGALDSNLSAAINLLRRPDIASLRVSSERIETSRRLLRDLAASLLFQPANQTCRPPEWNSGALFNASVALRIRLIKTTELQQADEIAGRMAAQASDRAARREARTRAACAQLLQQSAASLDAALPAISSAGPVAAVRASGQLEGIRTACGQGDLRTARAWAAGLERTLSQLREAS